MNINNRQLVTILTIIVTLVGLSPVAHGGNSISENASELLSVYARPMLKCLHPTGTYDSVRLLDTKTYSNGVAITGRINWRGGFTGAEYYSIVKLAVTNDMEARMNLIEENSSIPGGLTCSLANNWIPLSEFGNYAERAGKTLLVGAGILAVAAAASSSSDDNSKQSNDFQVGAYVRNKKGFNKGWIGRIVETDGQQFNIKITYVDNVPYSIGNVYRFFLDDIKPLGNVSIMEASKGYK